MLNKANQPIRFVIVIERMNKGMCLTWLGKSLQCAATVDDIFVIR